MRPARATTTQWGGPNGYFELWDSKFRNGFRGDTEGGFRRNDSRK